MERAEAEAIYEQGREVVVAVLLRMDEQIQGLEKRVAQQDERIARLEREAKRSSRNSSQPPSQDPPGAPKRGKDRSGRRAGGQPGHEGKGRPLLPAWAVDEVVDHWPRECGCGHVFGDADRVAAGEPARRGVGAKTSAITSLARIGAVRASISDHAADRRVRQSWTPRSRR